MRTTSNLQFPDLPSRFITCSSPHLLITQLLLLHSLSPELPIRSTHVRSFRGTVRIQIGITGNKCEGGSYPSAMQSLNLFNCVTAPSSFQLQQQLKPLALEKLFFKKQGHHLAIQNEKHVHGLGLRRRDIRRLGFGGCESHASTGAAVVRAGMAVKERVASWDSLSDKLRGRNFVPSERVAHAKERLYGLDQKPKLVFYRDTSSWCPYCERVWLQLEEKQIPYSVEKINMRCYGDKPDWYTKLVPSGLLPAVLLDGEVLTESLDIMYALEEKFPDNNPLLPKRDTPEFAALDGLLNLERDLFGAWLTRLIEPRADGGAFGMTMDRVNTALEQFNGPYFLGSQFSLVDAVYAPFLERIAASVPYWSGIPVRGADRWPAVNAWYNAMDSRASYQAIKSDDFSITHNLEPQIGSCYSEDAGAPYRALVDGTDGSWDLPLKPEVTAWGADDGTGKAGAKEEAAQSLIENHERIVEFAIRGVTGGEAFRGAVDVGFRHVAEALLYGTENVEIQKDLPKEVVIAAAYLRDRVGVPRDLTYPAARQLRAHLNWLVKQTGLELQEADKEDNRFELETQTSNGGNQPPGLNSWLYPSKDELPDDKEMSIFDHLEELRERLVISVGAVGAAMLGCFFFAKDLIKVLEAPVYSQGVRFLQLSPGEYFFTTLKVSGYCGLLIASPVILYEIIAFVLPGLTRSERRFLGPIVLGSSALFYIGVGFSYAVLTPAALNFFVNYAEGVVESLWSIDQYFEFVLVLLFSTGLSFQVPVIQLLLGQTGLVTAEQMLSAWRYVVVGAVVAAAILTPSTDPLTQVLLAGPLIGLYMGGALLVKFLGPEEKISS